ncbi:hypothetical protein D3C84_1021340 [compost metagenome]
MEYFTAHDLVQTQQGLVRIVDVVRRYPGTHEALHRLTGVKRHDTLICLPDRLLDGVGLGEIAAFDLEFVKELLFHRVRRAGVPLATGFIQADCGDRTLANVGTAVGKPAARVEIKAYAEVAELH